jgi:hypothetical protein
LSPQVRVAGAQARLARAVAEAPRQWIILAPRALGAAPGEFVFDSRAHFPADRLRLLLPQANTVVAVQWFSREREQDQWRSIARSTVYRLAGSHAESLSPPLTVSVDSDRYWLLRIDQRGGGLGAGTAQLELGWIPQELVFAARGEAPFTLAFGRRNAAGAALPVEALIPGYGSDPRTAGATDPGDRSPVPLGRAVLRAPPRPVILPEEKGLGRLGEPRVLAMWAAMLAGVALLGLMTVHLVRQMRLPPSGSKSE